MQISILSNFIYTASDSFSLWQIFFYPKRILLNVQTENEQQKHFQRPAKLSLKRSEQFSSKVDLANFISDGFHEKNKN